MLKPEQVPDEVEMAMRDAMMRGEATFKDIAAAAINAWPGMWTHEIMGKKMCGLPLWNGNKNE